MAYLYLYQAFDLQFPTTNIQRMPLPMTRNVQIYCYGAQPANRKDWIVLEAALRTAPAKPSKKPPAKKRR